MPRPSNLRIAGVGLFLFSVVLLGVGIHHLVATGTCSSTGYSANLGPVPRCPAGTGWWFAFVFGGIFGGVIGALMAGSLALLFAGIFGAIGFGALTVIFDSSAGSRQKLFAGIFGGCFALVGVIAGVAVIGSVIASVRGGLAQRSAAPTGSSFMRKRDRASTFGTGSKDADPIMSAYNASRTATANAPPRAPRPSPRPPREPAAPSPLSLVPGLQGAAAHAAAKDSIDELAKLADLHRQGELTDEEFANAKAKLLGKM